MANGRLVWDKTGEHYYETGVDRGVLYTYDPEKDNGEGKEKGGYTAGVVWNGLTAVTESPSGAEANPFWADNMKYLNLMSAEDFGCTIEAYTYPDEWAECDGSAYLVDGVSIGQQKRKMFGFSYRTVIGNDTSGNDLGYKIHIVYGCLASPSERGYTSINDSPEAITFSWEISTTPVGVSDVKVYKTNSDGSFVLENGEKVLDKTLKFKPTAHLEIDSLKTDSAKLKLIEDKLYGTDGEGSADGTEATLLTPDDIVALLAA